MVRTPHEFHGSNSEKTSSSFSVLQPMALHSHYFILIFFAMFPSIFWSTKNEKYSIAGSIPSLLLSVSCKEDGFSNIPTHVSSRLKNASSSTSSDYCYAIFLYDLIFSIAVNNCYMRQHRKGVTSSKTAAGGFYLLYKDD